MAAVVCHYDLPMSEWVAEAKVAKEDGSVMTHVAFTRGCARSIVESLHITLKEITSLYLGVLGLVAAGISQRPGTGREFACWRIGGWAIGGYCAVGGWLRGLALKRARVSGQC